MNSYYLLKLQAEYRSKIIAAGFKVVRFTEDDEQDGIGYEGTNYVAKNGAAYSFEGALDVIGEYDNYRAAISAECAKMREQSRNHFESKDWSKHVSMIDEGA